MNVQIVQDHEALSEQAAQLIAEQIREQPALALGLPTGRTPLELYHRLAEMHQRGAVDFGRASVFHLDEFYPIAPDHPGSFQAYMWRELLSHVNVEPQNVHFLDGLAEDPAAECLRYEEQIAQAGGLDFVLLGIGVNGHIGFNEPETPFDARTHVVTLERESREANAYLFPSVEEVPERGLTMGIGTMMEARQVMLIAAGAHKAQAIKRALEGPITPEIPASILRRHARATVMVDRQASTLLNRT